MTLQNNINQQIKWLEPLGGVLIVVDEESAGVWNATSGGDFDFACSFSDYTTVSTYNWRPIIVLGDEPLRTGIVQMNDGQIFIIRWLYADSEEQVRDFVESVDFDREIPILRQTTELNDTQYVIFDGVEAFCDVVDSLRFTLSEGTYTIETYELEHETLKIILDRITQ